MTASAKLQSPDQAPFQFSFEEFSTWYSELEDYLLRPALQAFERILNQTLDQELSDVDRLRVRVSNSRIKNASRLWTKMLREGYLDEIQTLADIPDRVDDLVGLRVTCNNLSDVEAVRGIILSLASLDPDEMPSGLCIDPHSERRHVKDSGYRAWHINLHTLVAGRSEWLSARGELQVRTRLQDSWGELTHEDTYKPGTSMPRLITDVAKQMAGLLAAVDDLAQVLRNELDSLALQDVGGISPVPPVVDTVERLDGDPSESAQTQNNENQRESLLAETRRVVDGLTRPAPLAQVAWQVQANFGRSITTDWGGFGTFKELLRVAAPNVTIIDLPPGTVVPTGAQSRDLAEESLTAFGTGQAQAGVQPGVPDIVVRLRRRDSGIPTVPPERLAIILELVESVLTEQAWRELDLDPGGVGIREINSLTRRARDLRSGEDGFPPKSNIDYILKSLYFSQNLRPGLDRRAIAEIVGRWLYVRASRLALISDATRDREELDQWLSDAVGQPTLPT